MNLFEDLKGRGLIHDYTDQPELFDALGLGGLTL